MQPWTICECSPLKLQTDKSRTTVWAIQNKETFQQQPLQGYWIWLHKIDGFWTRDGTLTLFTVSFAMSAHLFAVFQFSELTGPVGHIMHCYHLKGNFCYQSTCECLNGLNDTGRLFIFLASGIQCIIIHF